MNVWRHAILILILSVGDCPITYADDYPQKPITVILPLWAGGSHDLTARVFTRVMARYLDQPMIVKMMPGAAGQKATSATTRARPDGYTLLYTHNYMDQLQKHVEYLPYDPMQDLITVARINYAPLCILVRHESPFETLTDLLNYAKENPAELTLAHSGIWGAQFVPSLRILLRENAHMTFVPYQGGGPAMHALVAGDADVGSAFPSVALPLADAGVVRMLACAGADRLKPDIPTLVEFGFDDDLGVMHRIVLAPRDISDSRLKILRDAFRKVNADDEYRALMNKMGENAKYQDGREYEKLRQKQSSNFEALVKSLNVSE